MSKDKYAERAKQQRQDLEYMAKNGFMLGSALHEDRMLSWQDLDERGLITRDNKTHGYPVLIGRITEKGRQYLVEQP